MRAGPGRGQVEAGRLLALQRGGPFSPDVWLVAVGSERAVVKDWAGRGPLRDWLGGWLSRREARIYEALAEHPGVPRLLGRVDRRAFAVEHRPGRRMSRSHAARAGPRFTEQLAAALRGVHGRGVVHLDLRHRSNVRLDLHGRPVLVDFGASLCFRPGGLGARWLLPWLARWDRRAIRKWRRLRPVRVRVPAARDYALASSVAGGGGPSESGRGIRRPT